MAPSVVICENKMLIGKLHESQLWRLIERDLLFSVLPCGKWLALLCLSLILGCLLLRGGLITSVQHLVDVGVDNFFIFCDWSGCSEGRLLLYLGDLG